MSSEQFIFASLRHYRRIHIAVALGVAVATAVLTGALLIGDSMRGSLRDLTLQRLGSFDTAIVSPHFFREKLASEIAFNIGALNHSNRGEKQANPPASVAILLNGTLESGTGKNMRRANSVSVVGYGPNFAQAFGEDAPTEPLPEGEVAITQSLASELDVKAGDTILLRVPAINALPADSPLGAKQTEKTTRSRRLKVSAVLPSNGIARFGLLPTQQLPRNLFVPIAALQSLLDQPEKANAILISGGPGQANEAIQRTIHAALKPKVQDYGIRVRSISIPSAVTVIVSDELVLSDAVIKAVQRAYPGYSLQPVVTYLANTISVGGGGDLRQIPYSTISGVESLPGIGPLLDAEGKPIELADDEIVLNRWAADDLKAKIGDEVTVTFYEPESTHGQLRQRQPSPVFKLRAIVELKDTDGKPTTAADPNLTPEMPGVTDRKAIEDWDLPFELVEEIRPQDETYWDEHRTTPKAFISLKAAERLFASRWGAISMIRIPTATSDFSTGLDPRKLADEIDPASVGMQVLPVKRMGLAAASGTTPFEGLFLGFSFFLIAAALMLISLLFRLGVEQRARELGTLASVGIDRKHIARFLSGEGLIVAITGATLGIFLGIAYAWLMITGLRTWWLAAIATPFLELHVTPLSLLIGWVVGVAISWLTIRWSVRRLTRQPVGRLLAGSIDSPATVAPGSSRLWSKVRPVLLLLVVALCGFGFFLKGEAQAGSFFGSGALVLVLLLGEVRNWLRNASRKQASGAFSLWKLAALNTARSPGRSTLTIGLVAAASFLIIAVSAFQLETSDAGTGGFEFLATSDQPIHYDLNTPDGRSELGIQDQRREGQSVSDEELLRGWRIYSLRVASGEDASCLNLYRPTQPRVLGVPKAFIDRGGFNWAAAEINQQATGWFANPWTFLLTEPGNDDAGRQVVPVVLDASTAIYSLHLKGVGSRFTIHDAVDEPVTLEVVGLLKNSVLQGSVLMSEQNFLRLFPDTGGYRFFLIERSDEIAGPLRGPESAERSSAASKKATDLPQLLEATLAEDGFDVVDAREQLAAFLAVQNTYLSTFRSLGALGLLLGTIGLAVVQLRSVLERRGELALMRAGGFRSGRLVRMVILENGVLLVGGLAVGCVAAAVALIPQWAPQAASVPWRELVVLLGSIAVVGLLAGWLATRSALRAPIVSALRGD